MSIDPDELVAAVASGETAQVNQAIDRASAPDPVERFQRYDELFAAARPVFEAGDGYVRQSTVRLLSEGYPGLEWRLGSSTDEAVDGVRLEDTTALRHRFIEFLVEALDDDDGRVRRAAVTGLKSIETALSVAELEAEHEALHDVLSELAVRQPEAKRAHTERAVHHVGRPGIDEVLAEFQMEFEER